MLRSRAPRIPRGELRAASRSMGTGRARCPPFEARPAAAPQGEVNSSDRDDGSVLRRMVVGPARLGLGKNLDQPAAGVARIDDVVDAEAFGGAQGADAGARLVDHLLPALLRVGRALVFLAEG